MSESTENQRLTVEIARQWVQQQKTLDEGGEVAAEERISEDQFTALESGVAMILARSGLSSIDMRNLRSLTLDDALALQTYGGELYLNGLELLEPEVEEVVARFHAYILEVYRLKQLQTKALARRLANNRDIILRDCAISEKAAAVFAKRRATLMLGAPKRLSPDVRRILVEGQCDLLITKTGVIQEEDVRGFGRFTKRIAGRLVFYNATGISPHAAGELGGYPGDKIKFDKPVTLSVAAAEGISKFRGTLKFQALMQLRDNAAAKLANAAVEVGYYSTRCAALPRVALSRHGIVVVKDKCVSVEKLSRLLEAPHLNFSHLTNISAPVARLLADGHVGTLTFSGVRSISPEVAESLSRHRGGIAFDGLERLTPRVAIKLAALNGFLAFRKLRSLSAAAAVGLARHKGRLILDGLESLPSKTAASLQEHSGDLSLTRLQHLSVKAAQMLVRKPGRKVLTSLRSLDAMYVLLKEDADRVVVPFELNDAGDLA